MVQGKLHALSQADIDWRDRRSLARLVYVMWFVRLAGLSDRLPATTWAANTLY